VLLYSPCHLVDPVDYHLTYLIQMMFCYSDCGAQKRVSIDY